MKEYSPEEAYRKAQALCSQSEHCASEVMEKLMQWGIGEAEMRDSILSRLTAESYLDENRFCNAFVHDKLRFNGWGRVKIAQALAMKKVCKDSVAEALALIDEEEYQVILKKTLHAKRRQTAGDGLHEINRKLLRFAVGRGFELPLVLQTLKISDVGLE